MSLTTDFLKKAAVLIVEQQEKIAELKNEIDDKESEIKKVEGDKKSLESNAKKDSIIGEIINLLSEKKSMSTDDVDAKRKELMESKTEKQLQTYLQALNQSSVYSEKLARVSSMVITKELDAWDRALMAD